MKKPILNTIALILLLTPIVLLFNPGQANAISNVGPDEADFPPNTGTNDVMFEVTRRCGLGCGGFLEAPESTAVVYFRTTTGTVTIRNGNQNCVGDAYNAPTRFYFYRGGDPNIANQYTNVHDSAMNCGDYNVTVPNLDSVPSVDIGTETFYAVTVRAVHLGTEGINAFEILGPSSAVVSYYNRSGDFFTIQDKEPSNSVQHKSTFNLKFGSDCTVNGPTKAILRWFDDDHRDAPGAGPNYNQSDSDYRMEVYQTTPSGNRSRLAYLNYNGSNAGFTPIYDSDGLEPSADGDRLSNNNYGWTGDDKSGWAGITVRPDYQYEWIWYGVKSSNGVNFQVPYNSIYYLYDCAVPNTQPTINANANCTRIYGRAGDLDGTTRVQARIEHGGSATVLNTGYVLNRNPDEAFSLTIPNSYKSANADTRVEWVRVQDVGPAGSGYRYDTNPFGTTSDNNLNLGRCGTNWEYNALTPTTNPASSNTYNPKPGDTIAISGVTEALTGSNRSTGASFQMRIQRRYRNDSGNWTSGWANVRVVNRAPIAPGNTRSMSANFTIPNSFNNDYDVCFRVGASPWRGESPPTRITQSGWDDSGIHCLTVFNERFNMDDLTISPVGGTQIFPGDRTDFTFNFANTGNPAQGGYTNAVRGVAPNINGNVAISRGNGTIHTGASTTQTVQPGDFATAQTFEATATGNPGDDICFRLTVSPDRGFSHAADRQAVGNETLEECFNLGEAPYLEVHGADVWAGGEFAGGPDYIGGGWCPFIPPTDSDDAFIQSVRRTVPGSGNEVGSSVDYGASAMSDIVGFVTTSLENNSLHFANTPSSGNLNSEGRCVTDYFNYLSRDADDGVTVGVGGSGIPGGNGQFYRDGNLAINSNVNLGTRQIVLIVNGDVTINNDIVYGNYSVNNPGNIPFFMLVASGDIDISEDVDTLDGIYVSQGVDGIDTCYDNNNSGRLTVNMCNNQLTVHGMFIARDIQFRRTHSGVVRNAADQPNQGAELFDFSPELYLAQPRLISNYERSLPASQVKDLPPIY